LYRNHCRHPGSRAGFEIEARPVTRALKLSVNYHPIAKYAAVVGASICHGIITTFILNQYYSISLYLNDMGFAIAEIRGPADSDCPIHYFNFLPACR
jgi:hypothetical protein